mmetsp:Transcript_32231/g.37870  ORF Transcript_32231/g.37870 Transcript_32231/m.37870 type:complete len:260 (-) Transcript_32231:144-923(-)|eukprot:CAMPEP_0114336554 /NCGR_PEP_ID=MMETSP0101-20121206/5788_1 /TAXON_ID=38822 ORGANISM="Pteridomonas danica, Strain PT" /NCGR_SAMPLE_ID=MMETSP0101 /ASSEMBLY_ACC=CAM_ASM_000211 /LENGTH=259 /DNA_ID=CAMNT_0001468523 /DNA_START=56 /DNA_END=835 /DNA_ORIENTATION=-
MAAFTDAVTLTPTYHSQVYQKPTEIKAKLFECDISSLSEVKALVEQGALPLYFKEGTTPLHIASGANAVETTKFFLDSYCENGEVIDAMSAKTDALQETPLICACENGSLEVVELLLKMGASALDQNSYGSTCLHLASRAPRNAPALTRLLLQAGAKISVANHRGLDALHFAPFAEPESDAVEVAGILVEAGAQVNAQDLQGATPLHVAITKKSAPLVKALVALGADPLIRNAQGKTCTDLLESLATDKERDTLLALLK